MYGELGLIVGRRGGPLGGSFESGSELTVSMSAATAWPVHDWPFWSRTLPARPSRTGGSIWSLGRYWRSRASNGSGSAFVAIVLLPSWNSDGTFVLTIIALDPRPRPTPASVRGARQSAVASAGVVRAEWVSPSCRTADPGSSTARGCAG